MGALSICTSGERVLPLLHLLVCIHCCQTWVPAVLTGVLFKSHTEFYSPRVTSLHTDNVCVSWAGRSFQPHLGHPQPSRTSRWRFPNLTLFIYLVLIPTTPCPIGHGCSDGIFTRLSLPASSLLPVLVWPPASQSHIHIREYRAVWTGHGFATTRTGSRAGSAFSSSVTLVRKLEFLPSSGVNSLV